MKVCQIAKLLLVSVTLLTGSGRALNLGELKSEDICGMDMEYTDLDGKVFVAQGNRLSLEAPYKTIFDEKRSTKNCLYQIRNYMINRNDVIESGVELKSVHSGALPKFDGADLSYDQGVRVYRRLEFKSSPTSKLVAIFLLKDAIEEFVVDWQRQHPAR